jgi:hypothetical protein
VVLNNTSNNQSFIENVPFAVTSVVFDPNKNVVSKNNVATLDTTQVVANTVMRLFPNPTSSRLNLQMPDGAILAQVIMYNTLGQTIVTSTETSWDVSSFSQGIYYLKVFYNTGTQTFRFIKS